MISRDEKNEEIFVCLEEEEMMSSFLSFPSIWFWIVNKQMIGFDDDAAALIKE